VPIFIEPETGTTMGPAGMGSAPPNFPNYSMPDFSARESYINEMNNPNSITNYLNQHNQQQEAWENLEGPGWNMPGEKSPWNPLGDVVGPEAYPIPNENILPYDPQFFTPSWMNAGLFDDPTADGGWLDNLSRWWYGDDDPENDYLDLPPGLPPSDGFEPYDPTNPNHFMIPEGIEDMDIEDILEQMQGEKLEANLENNDLYHLMRNGYTLEEAQEILNEQIGDGSFEVAELTDPQIDFMNSSMGTPDFYSSYQDYKDAVDSKALKGWFSRKIMQEPATDQEVIEFIKQKYGTLPWSTVI
jgi:hypothetical protein